MLRRYLSLLTFALLGLASCGDMPPTPAAAPEPKDKPNALLWRPVPAPTTSPQLGRKFKKREARKVLASAAQIVRKQAQGDLHPSQRGLLTKIVEQDVLVVRGAFDSIGAVLEALRVRHHSAQPSEMYGEKARSLDRCNVVLWACGERLPTRHVKDVCLRLRRFVNKGGFLYTTDWVAANILTHAFPGRIESDGPRAYFPELILPITASPDAADHLYLRGVLTNDVHVKWWLEQASFEMKGGSSFGGLNLLEAAILRDKFNRSPVVAAVFGHGKGRVLHSLGHAFQEAGNLAGAVASQRLMLNFLLMAQFRSERRPDDGLSKQ